MNTDIHELKKQVEAIIYTSFWAMDKSNIYISSFTEDFMADKLIENRIDGTDEFKNNVWLVLPKDSMEKEMFIYGKDAKSALYRAVFRNKLLLIADPELIRCFRKAGATIHTEVFDNHFDDNKNEQSKKTKKHEKLLSIAQKIYNKFRR